MNRLLTREEIFEGNILHIYKDTVEIEDNLTVEREVVQHIGGVGIALEDKDGKFFFVKQWRYAQKKQDIQEKIGYTWAKSIQRLHMIQKSSTYIMQR